jgi:hypothetical protein
MDTISEFDFTLPRGYTDSTGVIHREGKMRLAVALDEIDALKDPRVMDNDAYLPVILLSRVITRLGNLDSVTPQIIEHLYVADFSYLEDLYLRINSHENMIVAAVCPNCSTEFQLQVAPLNNENHFG